jgi:chemotaxis protein MotB
MMRERRKNHISRDRWLVSYADFITLLFALFVVLFAFAKADQKKQIQVAAAIETAFHSLGIMPDTTHHPYKAANGGDTTDIAAIVMSQNVISPARVKNDLEILHHALEQSLSKQVAAHAVSMKMGKDGLVISLREAGFFSSGSATPKPESLPTLRQIAASLDRTPYDLRIEGHTDNIPIHTAEFDSNWELSAARATHIARIFIDLKTVPPDRISAAGYAEFHPVASNNTPEGRAENRRVDLVVLPRTTIDLSASAPPHPTGEWRKITDDDAAAQGATNPAPSNP